MASTIIQIENEKHYNAISKVMKVNDIDNRSRQKVITKALEIAYNAVTYLDEESLIQICNLKKTL